MAEDEKLKVIVTGASSGIGRAAAELFLKNGHHVALVARRQKNLVNIVEWSKAHTGRAFPIVADLSSKEGRELAIAEAVKSLGQVDVLVNSAGIIRSGKLADTSLESWNEMLEINLTSVFDMMRLCLPHLEKSKGNVVNISSVTGLRSFPGILSYSVAKAGIDQLTRCAALEWAPLGIRVNAVNPGVVVTELHRTGGMSEDAYTAFLEHCKLTHPLGRAGEASEVAEAIYFLSSKRSAWTTGVTLSLDGGRALTCAR
ncbi:MAG: SDR family oxidoreductase [Bdellovibrionales bacterium]